MISTIGLSFDDSLNFDTYVYSKGHESAISFINAIIKRGFTCVDPNVLEWPTKETDPRGILTKFFSSGHCEYFELSEILKESLKVDATVGCLFSDIISVKVCFNGKSDKMIYQIKTSFYRENGVVISMMRYKNLYRKKEEYTMNVI